MPLLARVDCGNSLPEHAPGTRNKPRSQCCGWQLATASVCYIASICGGEPPGDPRKASHDASSKPVHCSRSFGGSPKPSPRATVAQNGDSRPFGGKSEASSVCYSGTDWRFKAKLVGSGQRRQGLRRGLEYLGWRNSMN